MDNQKIAKQTLLFKSIQCFRLQYDMHLVKSELNKNKPTHTATNDGVIKRLFATIDNGIKSNTTEQLLSKKERILDEYN